MSAIRFTNSMSIKSNWDYLEILIAPNLARAKNGNVVAQIATKRERKFVILPRKHFIECTSSSNLSDNLPKFVSSRFPFLYPKVDRTGWLNVNGDITNAPHYKMQPFETVSLFDVEKVSL
jgi:hypothetical protein